MLIKKDTMKLKFSEVVAGSLIFTLAFGLFGYSFVEPMFVDAVTDDVVVTLNVSPQITISDSPNVTMSQSLDLTADFATASSTWTVVTNDTDGYTLTVQATSTPAMQSGTDTIADFTATVPTTPEAWVVSSGNAEFGFSAFGTDVPTGTWGSNTTACSTGHNPALTQRLYRGFNGATTIQIASSNATTTVSGTPSTVCYGVEQNGTQIPSGTYTATITATATVN